MICYDDALCQVLDTVVPLPPREISLTEAGGLVLATPARAKWDMPRCDNSAMDGFAVTGAPSADALLRIIGSSYAGHAFNGSLKADEAIRITTGAPLPLGADTIIPIEDVEEYDGQIRVTAAPRACQHVRYRGEEYREGDIMVDAGTSLQAGEIAVLAGGGITQVKVVPRPRIAVISTGDELVELGTEPGHGQIVNSNQHLLCTRLSECGYDTVCLGIGDDNLRNLQKLFERALDADVIISTGGVSVGDKDHVQAALETLGFIKKFWKVAIKPGKPLLFGLLNKKPYFGLPGNPAATAATLELFALPALRKMAGWPDPQTSRRRGMLTSDVRCGGNRQTFLWCKLEWFEDQYLVTVRQGQGSGQNRSIQGANALLSVPVGTKWLMAGDMVDVQLINN
jgi:molybdopterin molybdotransferase